MLLFILRIHHHCAQTHNVHTKINIYFEKITILAPKNIYFTFFYKFYSMIIRHARCFNTKSAKVIVGEMTRNLVGK